MTQISQENWDFKTEDVRFMTHGIHMYPARMVPQIAERLIAKYGKKGGLVLDPFSGSGGVLVEALRANHNSVGLDINPLACLLSRVKSNPINPERISSAWKDIRNRIAHDMTSFRFKQFEPETPDFGGFNIDYWFKPYMIKELSIIRSNLGAIKESDVRDFFYACFSNTVRAVSGTRKGEFKLYRMEPEKWKSFSPDVFQTFEEKVNMSLPRIGELYSFVRENRISARSHVFQADTRKMFTDEFHKEAGNILTEGSVHLIVTSPPYGDSHTTVAYGQFSRHSLLWLGYPNEETLEVDKTSIGGRTNGHSIKSPTLEKILSQIGSPIRRREVYDFFADLGKCLSNLAKVLADNGYACFVLGNRTVNKIRIPADDILSEIGKDVGLSTIDTIKRNIPTKRIPWKSSPTNIAGEKVETMNKESIVILKNG